MTGSRVGAPKGGPYAIETGEGACPPSPQAATPNGDIPTVHCMGRPRGRTRHGFPPAIATDCPRAGRGRRPKAGWGL